MHYQSRKDFCNIYESKVGGVIWLRCVLADADLERVTMQATNTLSSQHDEALGLSAKTSSTIYRYIGQSCSSAIFLLVRLVSICFDICLAYHYIVKY